MNVSTTLRPSEVEWLALADGVGHAQPKHGRDRTVCGQSRMDPRFAHPIATRCPVCTGKVAVR